MSSSHWTRGTDPAKAAEIEETLKNSYYTLDIVRQMVYNVYVDVFSTSKSDYEKPAWAFYKANQEGRQEGLELILGILNQKLGDHSANPKQRTLTDVDKAN